MGKIKLKEISTRAPEHLVKEDIKKEHEAIARRIGELQEMMFANGERSLLIVLQGMDSSGKDGSARETFQYCSPNGVKAHSFKKPTEEEFAHDFLWRCHKIVPRKGNIGIFIRSHYEDILIQRVHGWIDKDRVDMRINAINAFEELLAKDNGTTILKFYMHLSYKKQGKKLKERIDEPDKNWKHNPGDWEERKHWDSYMNAYEDAINRCNAIPWIIAPVDQRWYRNYFIAKKVLETMESWNMSWPELKDE